jgi:hypothetical protein
MAILSLAFVIRLIHLSYSPSNPLTYHPSADEDYYINFGMNVAHSQFELAYDFIFMDPLYGYFLGFIFYLFGQNLLIVYLIQTIVDTLTVLLIFYAGKELWNHRAGIISSCFYALSSTSLLYTTKILNPTLVANFIILWSLLTVRIWKTDKIYAWFWYGNLLGVGVAIRSNLLLLAIIGIVVVPWGNFRYNNFSLLQYQKRCAILILGFSIPLILLGIRNYYITDNWSILPTNGGIVLHQIYNASNPNAEHKVPEFVRYSSPTEIWHGYKNEAEKRLNSQLSAKEVNSYWFAQAMDYIFQHPKQTINNLVRKLGDFASYKEVNFNKSLAADELFSPILSFLPRPFGWLLSLGIPGLLLLAWKTPRAWPIILAAASILVTFMIFIAAARFRFHALPLLAVGSRIFISSLLQWEHKQSSKNITAITLAVLLAGTTLFTGIHTE